MSGSGSTGGGDAERLRLGVLAELGVVGTSAEERFDRITRLAREIFQVPGALINLVDAEQQFTKSPHVPGIDPYRARVDSFCEVAIGSPGILVVEDATQDDRFAWRSPVTGAEHVRFYAGRPLDGGDGMLVGTLCIVDTVPRTLSARERELLDELGDWAERELRAEAERTMAADVQRSLLPRSRPLWPHYDVRAASVPARTLTGDFYDWTESESGFAFTLADVMGKGEGAAILAALVRATIAAQGGTDPGEVVTCVNRLLWRDFEPNSSFATLVHALLDPATGSVAFSDAGHGLSLVLRSDGRHERLASTSLPIGILADGEWRTDRVLLEPGDWFVSVTDGVLDLFDGTLASLDDVAALVQGAEGAQSAIDAILAHRESASDDVSVLALRRLA